MSTTIIGHRIPHPIGKAYRLLLDEKPHCTQLSRSLQYKWIADRASQIIDQKATGSYDGADRSPIGAAYNELREQQADIIRRGYRNPLVDFDFKLYLFPKGSMTYVVKAVESREMTEWFSGLDFQEDYSYWNGTDRPDNVTAAEWNRRAKLWRELIPITLGDRCLEFTLADSFIGYPSTDDIIALVPTMEKRLRSRAILDLMADYAREATTKTMSEYMSAYHAASNDEVAISAAMERLRAILPEITPEMLGRS